jgi:hypothetical protein
MNFTRLQTRGKLPIDENSFRVFFLAKKASPAATKQSRNKTYPSLFRLDEIEEEKVFMLLATFSVFNPIQQCCEFYSEVGFVAMEFLVFVSF